jgi:hypothetical protein
VAKNHAYLILFMGEIYDFDEEPLFDFTAGGRQGSR